MSSLEIAVLTAGFVVSWFGRKAWRHAEAEIALRRHRRTLKLLNWRR